MFHDPGERYPMIFLTLFGNTLQRVQMKLLTGRPILRVRLPLTGTRSISDQSSLGLIRERSWYGEDGMQHLRTKKEPKQPIPTFAETVALLMRVSRLRLTAQVLTHALANFLSPRTNMSNLTSTSKCRMTQIVFFDYCMSSFLSNRNGKQSLHRASCLDFGIRVLWRTRKRDCLIAVDPTLASVRPWRASTFGMMWKYFRWRSPH